MRSVLGFRMIAAAIDGMFGLVLAFLLSNTAGLFFAGRAEVMLRMGSPGTLWRGPVAMVLGMWGPLVYGLPFALLLILLTEPIVGRSPGKALLGLRVTDGDHAVPMAGPRWKRSALKCSALWIVTLALIIGAWQAAVVAALAGAITAGAFLGAFITGSRTLYDRAAGSDVRSGGLRPPRRTIQKTPTDI